MVSHHILLLMYPIGCHLKLTSVPTSHKKGAIIQNLNVLFLQEFFKKLKAQISPGFGDRTLKTNQKNFIINSNSFYKTKGTDLSYKILFSSFWRDSRYYPPK